MRRELYVIDMCEDLNSRVEVLHLMLEVEVRYDDRALAAVREHVVAWCARARFEFCGMSIARGAKDEGFIVARVRNLAPRRVAVTRSGRPIADPIERLVPTMAARRRSDRAGRA